MRSEVPDPAGRARQTSEFDAATVVIAGKLKAELRGGAQVVQAGPALIHGTGLKISECNYFGSYWRYTCRVFAIVSR